MSHRDVVAWTTMISGYALSSQHHDALLVFREMMGEGVSPNAYTISSVLKACRGAELWPAMAAVHGLAVKCGVDSQGYVENALLDVYMASHGEGEGMHDACAIFKGIVKKTVVSWTTMIAGYVHHGDGHTAVQAFQHMLQEGVELKSTQLFCCDQSLCLDWILDFWQANSHCCS
ncbi:hypothetical protein Taro_026869 [Colocasia esculenta]|uniref:Pentatricopeptide repeat-containing protein n=1 Tax=Colocasia esculenta TaxID=4460 RepID=A0A843VLX7_COLES|nr:hypothetical protein [Colocasia esculenta]